MLFILRCLCGYKTASHYCDPRHVTIHITKSISSIKRLALPGENLLSWPTVALIVVARFVLEETSSMLCPYSARAW